MWEGQAIHSPMNLKKKVKGNSRKDGGDEGGIGRLTNDKLEKEKRWTFHQ